MTIKLRYSHVLIASTALGIALGSACNEDARQAGDPDKKGDAMGQLPYEEGAPPTAKVEDPVADKETDALFENPFEDAAKQNVTTFSVDVDTASYSLTRQALNEGRLPDKRSVRAEEFINYFDYGYVAPALNDQQPFTAHLEVTAAPWKPTDRLVRIGIKAVDVQVEHRPKANLVFLVDVSGSMAAENKLPLLKKSLAKLLDQLNTGDRVAIVTYAGASGIALESTPADQKEKILAAIEDLGAGGGTNGEAGISAAYAQASLGMIADGINRVVLCTDGDFNLGQTTPDELVQLIQSKAEGGIFLTALGFGSYVNDTMLENLADKGDGNYAIIDTPSEADKVLIRSVTGTLVTVAKDVKVQLEFDQAVVAKYRLIGYENRRLKNEDFKDDKKDAGEIGAGHTVTALYEIELVKDADVSKADLATMRLRYKKPGSDEGIEMESKIHDDGVALAESSSDLRFAASAAAFAMKLRGSAYIGDWGFAEIKDLAKGSLGSDLNGYRSEMTGLIDVAAQLSAKP